MKYYSIWPDHVDVFVGSYLQGWWRTDVVSFLLGGEGLFTGYASIGYSWPLPGWNEKVHKIKWRLVLSKHTHRMNFHLFKRLRFWNFHVATCRYVFAKKQRKHWSSLFFLKKYPEVYAGKWFCKFISKIGEWEMIQFDESCSDGLVQPPTSISFTTFEKLPS